MMPIIPKKGRLKSTHWYMIEHIEATRKPFHYSHYILEQISFDLLNCVWRVAFSPAYAKHFFIHLFPIIPMTTFIHNLKHIHWCHRHLAANLYSSSPLRQRRNCKKTNLFHLASIPDQTDGLLAWQQFSIINKTSSNYAKLPSGQ